MPAGADQLRAASNLACAVLRSAASRSISDCWSRKICWAWVSADTLFTWTERFEGEGADLIDGDLYFSTKGDNRLQIGKELGADHVVNIRKVNDVVQAVKDDPRVTKVGRFLRATSIDELPQLWNVVQGQMAFIGPRPIPIALYEELCRHIPDFPLRNSVPPGLTNLSQISLADNKLGDELLDVLVCGRLGEGIRRANQILAGVVSDLRQLAVGLFQPDTVTQRRPQNKIRLDPAGQRGGRIGIKVGCLGDPACGAERFQAAFAALGAREAPHSDPPLGVRRPRNWNDVADAALEDGEILIAQGFGPVLVLFLGCWGRFKLDHGAHTVEARSFSERKTGSGAGARSTIGESERALNPEGVQVLAWGS